MVISEIWATCGHGIILQLSNSGVGKLPLNEGTTVSPLRLQFQTYRCVAATAALGQSETWITFVDHKMLEPLLALTTNLQYLA